MFICEAIASGNHPQVTIRYFIPDALKSGGRYEVLSGTVKKVDITYRRMVFYGGNGISDGVSVKIDEISDIRGSSLNHIEEYDYDVI
jgi:hypothetical protein